MQNRLVVVLALLAATVTGSAPARAEAGVGMRDSQYMPREVTVKAGEAVVWTNEESLGHSVTADDGSFDSNPTCGRLGGTCMSRGETFSRTFSAPGRVPYYCRAHGAPGGRGMAGTVVVTG